MAVPTRSTSPDQVAPRLVASSLDRAAEDSWGDLPRPHVAPPLGAIRRVVSAVRLVHPFPSLLDGLVVAVVALVAGGVPLRAALLGASTVCLQFAIGTLNDLVDVPRDAGFRTGKPIADGVVSVPLAKAVLASCLTAGLVLALMCGPVLLLIAALGLGIGVWYDVRAKGTPTSWFPIALGVPLLPVFGWYGATGSLPPLFLVMIPAATFAGAGLAIANSIVDLERDKSAGSTSLSLALGPRRSAALVLAMHLVVAFIAIATAGPSSRSGPWPDAVVATAILPVAGALLGLAAARGAPTSREMAFEVQAVGLGLLAVAWVNALGAGA